MATKATVGKGLTLKVNTGTVTTPVFTLVAESLTADPAPKMGTEDATSFDSTALEFISTMADGGEFKFTANKVATDVGQLAVEAAGPVGSAPGTLLQFQVTTPKSGAQTTSGDVYTFSALVVEFNPAFKPDKKSVVSGTLRTSNGMVKTAGS